MGSWHLPPLRVLVAIGVTVLAMAVLGLRSCTDGGGGGSNEARPSSTSAGPGEVEDTILIPPTTSSIVVPPDWYPKQSGRYSDRDPVVTITTLAPTTSTSTTSTTVLSGDSNLLDGD